jgi:hypothetical protein
LALSSVEASVEEDGRSFIRRTQPFNKS